MLLLADHLHYFAKGGLQLPAGGAEARWNVLRPQPRCCNYGAAI